MKVILFLIIGYVMGALPNGVWIGKYFKGIDIREHGSKNSGATNSYRVLGPKYGLMVLAADALKGFLPPFLASQFGVTGNWLILIGMAAIIGHILSFFLNFKGGKGVATSLGVFLFLIPKVTLALLVIFIIVVYATRYISLGSIIAAILLPVLTFISPLNYGIEKWPMMVMTIIIAIFVVYKHKTNIERLLKGTENKFKLK
ncbi:MULTISPECIES: glycerol-3-phosphate 1-O-acyltransferase PlsY [Fusobacterium]|jgi:glycerol-3-phosphate acyltransferase PlsY|uniref:Glycerol-3-phosphate acyltransferase n=1 Tax=Fusobacterium hominis TaxID=2764326 RepID=A0A7G9GXS1_9FUSO|nr:MULTISPECIES: glycerol-3-phosphate 1-O-acyltransferase PlsY [Fusobacterium]QNM15603.1 glycerol-3-phosphate 1-O-acyltransferase PlsY [Fusobacterium hominis]